jgi:membrane protein implicated in regulation of membrane protease activity
MSAWAWWIVVAAAFGIGEMLTGGFYLLPFAVGALGGVIAGLAGAGTAIQIVLFLVASMAASGIVRPIARRHVTMPPQIRTGTAALIGTRALVIDRVAAHEGRVRIGGEVWTARPYLDGEVLEPGQHVHVVEIRGATALVAEE